MGTPAGVGIKRHARVNTISEHSPQDDIINFDSLYMPTASVGGARCASAAVFP